MTGPLSAHAAEPQAAADALLAEVAQRGGKDNASVIVAVWGGAHGGATVRAPQDGARRTRCLRYVRGGGGGVETEARCRGEYICFCFC